MRLLSIRIFFFITLLWWLGVRQHPAQAQEVKYGGTLVAGYLSGRIDLKAIPILTTEGLIKIDDEGNCPFLLVSNTKDKLVLKAKEDYRGGRAYLDTLILRFFNTESALIASLITGHVDFATLENEDSVEEVFRSNHDFRIVHARFQPNSVDMLCYNNQHPLFRDKRIRQAITYAIDRKEIIKNLLKNLADLAHGPLSPDSWAYNSHLKQYDFAPRKAMRILKELGWSDTDGDGILDKQGRPFRFFLIYEKGLILTEEIVREIKFNLNGIGIDLIPLPLAKTEINDRLRKRDFDCVLLRHQFQESAESFANFFSASSSSNFIGYYSPVFENYTALLKRVKERQRAKTILQSIQAVLNRDLPVSFLYFKWKYYHLVNWKKFENFQNSKGQLNAFELWFRREKLPKQ